MGHRPESQSGQGGGESDKGKGWPVLEAVHLPIPQATVGLVSRQCSSQPWTKALGGAGSNPVRQLVSIQAELVPRVGTSLGATPTGHSSQGNVVKRALSLMVPTAQVPALSSSLV